MMNIIIGLTFILYSLNFNIFMQIEKDYIGCKKHPFLNMLNHYGINTHRFMAVYQSLMYKSTFLFMVIGVIVVLRG